jgi:HK97 family phage major capsid protein
MAFLSDAAAGIVRPEELYDLIVRTIQQESVALQVSTRVETESQQFRFPILTNDVPSGWFNEGEDITLADPGVDQLIVTPKKIASITKISSELAEDSSPEAANLVRDSLARSAARTLDKAFFAASTPKGPPGLLSVAYQNVAAGSTFGNVDPFTSAMTKLEKVGSTATSFTANADTVEVLSKLKMFTGATSSNQPLLQPDPTQPTRRAINGVPLYSVADTVALANNYVWCLDSRKTFCVVRRAVTLDVSPHAFFGSDSVGVRLTMRATPAFPHPAACVLVSASGS